MPSPRLVLLVLASLSACRDPAAEDLPAPVVLPAPVSLVDGVGSYTLDADTVLTTSAAGEAVADLLAEALRPATGLPLDVVVADTPADDGISLVLDPAADLAPEGYTLEVTEVGATITAADASGLFYGTQTFRQLLPAPSFGAAFVDRAWRVPVVTIADAPRFAWRGAMFDVARHFFEVEEIERQIDLLALHKLNRLHLHLTDDQGWRIEIAAWPELTEVGGNTEVGGGAGGWYTQEDYAEIVDYADARHVTVVPEIDFPGHANAALSSVAALNEDGVAIDPYTGTGVISTPLWLDGPTTLDFVRDVWAEVAALTPGPWIHVGGDEAIGTPAADYATFVQALQEIADDQGKTLIGWDEIGPVPLDPPYVAQYWFDADNTMEAAANGAQIIASPAAHAYLDMRYDTSSDYGQIWAGYVDIEAAYDWDPVLSGLDEADVLGVEGALWTEYVDDEAKLDFMAWPRLVAHAELGWSAADAHGWPDFRDRLEVHGARLDGLDVGFYASPALDWE